jgi:hypothetical protein
MEDVTFMEILSSIVTFAITIGTFFFTRWSGMQVEARHREALHSAIMSGIGYARSALTGEGPAISHEEIVRQTTEYVERSVPDALKYFNLDKAAGMLTQMIAAKVANLVT